LRLLVSRAAIPSALLQPQRDRTLSPHSRRRQPLPVSASLRLDLDAIRELVRELGISRPLNFTLRQGAFVKKCSCPDPTHKGRRFIGFHTVRDGEHRIEVDVTRSPREVTHTIAHELAHAAQWERGEQQRHDNTLAYRANPREADADAFAASIVQRGRRLVKS
jgi:hypothetical protein